MPRAQPGAEKKRRAVNPFTAPHFRAPIIPVFAEPGRKITELISRPSLVPEATHMYEKAVYRPRGGKIWVQDD